MIDTIINGDCLEVMGDIPDGSIDMILCDLPYGTTACKWDTVIPFEPLWAHYKRVIKRNGAIVLFGNEPFLSTLVISNLDDFKYKWIWEKPQGINPLMSDRQPLNNFEEIAIFYKRQPTYNPIKTRGKPYEITRDTKDRVVEWDGDVYKKTTTVNSGFRFPKRIIRFNQEKGLHPTQKPVPLFEYLIRTYTNENELVLDSCSGSGTTAIACINSNRRYHCIEQDEGYYKASLERIAKHKLQPKLIY